MFLFPKSRASNAIPALHVDMIVNIALLVCPFIILIRAITSFRKLLYSEYENLFPIIYSFVSCLIIN